MPSRTLLGAADLARALQDLPTWSCPDGTALARDLAFADFAAAFAFMRAVADVAEELDHHPDWSNSWNRVSIRLSTHDRGGVTEFDLELARRIDRLAHAHGARAP
jgi:4a-hydroxytetrahydrobiopterin dehydratase